MDFHRHASISGNFFYEKGNEPRFGFEENYDRFGAGAALTYQVLRRLRAGLGYQITNKSSNIKTRDYRQHLMTLNVSYRF